jgi:hypothetical protein
MSHQGADDAHQTTATAPATSTTVSVPLDPVGERPHAVRHNPASTPTTRTNSESRFSRMRDALVSAAIAPSSTAAVSGTSGDAERYTRFPPPGTGPIDPYGGSLADILMVTSEMVN